MGEYRRARTVRLTLVGAERPADKWRNAERGEEGARDDTNSCAERPLAVGEVEAAGGEAGGLRKDIAHGGDVLDVEWEALVALAIEGDDHIGEDHELVRPHEGERAQERRVDGAEDRRRRADAEGEDGNDWRAEAGARAQSPRRVAEVLAQVVEPFESPHVATPLLDARGASELPPCGESRGAGAHAAFFERGGAELEVQAHFLLELARQLVAPEEKPKAPQQRAHSSGRLEDAGDGTRHAPVRFDLALELPASGSGEPIIPRAPVLVRLPPLADDPTLDEHALERRIEGTLLDAQHIRRGASDGVRDLEAVELPLTAERLEDEHVERAGGNGVAHDRSGR